MTCNNTKIQQYIYQETWQLQYVFTQSVVYQMFNTYYSTLTYVYEN